MVGTSGLRLCSLQRDRHRLDRSGHSRRGDTPQCTGGAADVHDVALWVRSGQRRGRTWAVPGWYPKIAGECIFFPPKCSNDRFPKSSILNFPKSWGYLVLKAMVTWGSFIFIKPHRDVDFFFRFDGKNPLEIKIIYKWNIQTFNGHIMVIWPTIWWFV